MKVYAFDIDGIICETKGSDYKNSTPNKMIIARINALYERGCVIKLFTGRGTVSGKDWNLQTRQQLNNWGVKYTEFIMGKPHYDYFLEDKMMTINDLFQDKEMDDYLIADMVRTYKSGNKILICGNGGLCAESSHFAAEMVGKYGMNVYLPAIALNDSTIMSGISNDFGFQHIFSHQIKVLGNKGDMLIAMTTSQSANVLEALAAGKEKQMVTVAITSVNSDKLFANYQIKMYGNDTAEVQNEIIKYLHRIAFEVKRIYAK